jgi:hypothetical protein
MTLQIKLYGKERETLGAYGRTEFHKGQVYMIRYVRPRGSGRITENIWMCFVISRVAVSS